MKTVAYQVVSLNDLDRMREQILASRNHSEKNIANGCATAVFWHSIADMSGNLQISPPSATKEEATRWAV